MTTILYFFLQTAIVFQQNLNNVFSDILHPLHRDLYINLLWIYVWLQIQQANAQTGTRIFKKLLTAITELKHSIHTIENIIALYRVANFSSPPIYRCKYCKDSIFKLFYLRAVVLFCWVLNTDFIFCSNQLKIKHEAVLLL